MLYSECALTPRLPRPMTKTRGVIGRGGEVSTGTVLLPSPEMSFSISGEGPGVRQR